jgi:RNA polymerase sigma-70 factor (ECF subfamily)
VVFAASYLQKVVLSVVIDASRRAQVRAADALPEEGEATPEAMILAEAPQRKAIEDQRAALILRAIGELPPRRRVPVQLHLQGFSFGEVGRLSGVSEEAARKLVTRGMLELRTRLAELGMDDGED